VAIGTLESLGDVWSVVCGGVAAGDVGAQNQVIKIMVNWVSKIAVGAITGNRYCRQLG